MTNVTESLSPSAYKPKNDGVFFGRHTLVWLLLVGVTAASWAMGHDAADPSTAGAIILALAFVKVRMVIREFMEVREAPTPLRIITDVWTGGACALLVGMQLFAARAG